MFRRVQTYMFVVLSSLLLACGTSSTDPCSLVASTDAERALGEPVQEGVRLDATTCVIKARGTEGNTVTVQIDEEPGKDRRSWFNKERLRRDSHLIPGLGDGAVRVDSSPTLSRLTFMHKDAFVTVIVSSTQQTQLGESVTQLGRTAATQYGASLTATLSPPAPTPMSGRGTHAEAVAPPAPVTLTRTLPAPSGAQVGPKKATSLDLTSLVGAWHTHFTQGTTQYDMVLLIQPNLGWSLSSMAQFEGVLNAEAGLWSLERANTFKGLGWKGTYRQLSPKSFSSTGSIQASWTRLSTDHGPTRIPTELWKLRREATSVPVFQLKSVDPDLVGQWEGSGTYAGGSAAFVWSIQPSAAADLLIVHTLRGTVKTKDNIPHLQPAQKGQRGISVMAGHDGGFTTTDGKTTHRWTKLLAQPAEDHQL